MTNQINHYRLYLYNTLLVYGVHVHSYLLTCLDKAQILSFLVLTELIEVFLNPDFHKFPFLFSLSCLRSSNLYHVMIMATSSHLFVLYVEWMILL